jgi:hypothetical protein
MIFSEIDFLIKQRDGAQMVAEGAQIIADACNERLERLAPPEPKELDLVKLAWEKRKGEKGEYEQTTEVASQNSNAWKQLKAKLKEHKGFWQNSGYKFWFHQQDETVIDRRKA